MPLFDTYVMIDWSGANRRRRNRPDCIWIAHGAADDIEPVTMSPPSRTDAEHAIRDLLRTSLASGRRVLVCASFAYGYPAGFASRLSHPAGRRAAPWLATWEYLRDRVRDDAGTARGRCPTNRSNRFEVAAAVNGLIRDGSARGPFWCASGPDVSPAIPWTQPPQPFAHRTGTLAPRRLTDRRAGNDTPFRLFGAGSVGSQVITGIPRLWNLRFDPDFARCSAVWPFETGWAPGTGWWPDVRIRILHAEIPASVRTPLRDTVKDRGQVRALWHWARHADGRDRLVREFAIPAGISSGSDEDLTIRGEEGWVLGCPA